MGKAYEYGADRVWIMNIGDIKPLEIPMDFFLTLAWNPREWNKDNIAEYTQKWAAFQFGDEQAKPVADIIDKYTKYNGWIKPELLSATTFSLVNYREAETVVSKWKAISDRADSIYASLDKEKKDAFFQLVLYPVKASYTLNNLYFNLSKNHGVCQKKASSKILRLLIISSCAWVTVLLVMRLLIRIVRSVKLPLAVIIGTKQPVRWVMLRVLCQTLICPGKRRFNIMQVLITES